MDRIDFKIFCPSGPRLSPEFRVVSPEIQNQNKAKFSTFLSISLEKTKLNVKKILHHHGGGKKSIVILYTEIFKGNFDEKIRFFFFQK